jgi:inhibitor of KinA
MLIQPDFDIYFLSEQAVTIAFKPEISEAQLQKITAFNERIGQNPFPGFRCSVPAYDTISVFYDPVKVIKSGLQGVDCFEKVSMYLQKLKFEIKNIALKEASTINIPVCYGNDFGPDLEELAKLHQLTTAEIIKLHSAAVYKVYLIGFVPGFAYLGGMNVVLDTPRKAVPRQKIPAGAVGIAGKQTGIYPMETPGGWQIIGRTPIKMFAADRSQPALLKAGDNIVFQPISAGEFKKTAE